MPVTLADLDDVRRELGPLVSEAVREHAADFDARTAALTAAVLTDREWLDTRAGALYLGIAERTFRLYRAQGCFGPVVERFSRQYVRRAAVDAYLATGPAPEPAPDASPGISSPDRFPDADET